MPGPRRRSRRFASTWVIVALAAVVILGFVALVDYVSTETVTFTVKEKESVAQQGGHEYRVYTDAGTFTVADSWTRLRFNSADVYGSIKENRTYECDVYGWRFGLFSMFKNILKCTEAQRE